MNAPREMPPPNQVCANCGAPLLGEYCYACGQPVKGMIRHLSSVLGDVFDTVLNIDSRIVHTLPALFLRPGFLTHEYFAGRRVRYVTPFRLMFFLCLGAFFAMQISFNIASSRWVHFGGGNATGVSTGFDQAKTVADVQAREKQALAGIDRAAADPKLPGPARASLELARQRIHSDAAERISAMHRAADKAAAPAPAASSSGAAVNVDGKDNVDLSGHSTWDLPRRQLHIAWLPGFVNDWLNQAGQRVHDNVVTFEHDTRQNKVEAIRRWVAGMFALLPQTMFVMLPLFAVLLKVFYIFKRRLYMEHLIVALHSHAFLFLALLVLFAIAVLKTWLLPYAGWIGVPLGLAATAVWIWMFVYLYLMQKRIYKQGWILTTLKYWCLGACYTVLLSLALTCAFVLSFVGA